MRGTQRIRLGESVELDPANECLIVGGEAVSLRPKVYGVLRHLVDHPDRIVTKDELLESVWAGTYVGDSVLKVCVRELRTALGDDTKAPRFIATVHRRGYRFVGEVEPVGDASSPTSRAQPEEQVESSSADHSTFVARSFELAHLEDALTSVAGGERRLVFISGAAGIGKTTLLEEALRRVSSSSGARMVRGRCQGTAGSKEPYLPFLECVRGLIQDDSGAALLRRVAPTWFVQCPWLLEDDDRAALEGKLYGATQSRMLRELSVFLDELSQEQTVVLILEDLHWGDSASVDLLSFLATRDSPARLLILAVTRTVELVVDAHPLRDVKRELLSHRRCTELPLELLGPEDVSQMVRHRLGGESVSPEVSTWLFSRTEGHPLFVVHLLEHLIASEHLSSSDQGWALASAGPELEGLLPHSLPGILDKILGRYQDDERLVLEAAALIGQEFDANAVAQAIDFEVDRVEELCDAIASREEVVVTHGIADLPGGIMSAQYRFTHALLRDSIRRAMAPAKLVRQHRRLAEWGEALYGKKSDQIASRLAVHFAEARLHRRAVHYHRVAATNARRAFSNDAALEHLLEARALLQHKGSDTGAELIELDYDVARTLRASGDLVGAGEAYESIAEAAASPAEASEAWLFAAGARSWLGRDDCMRCVEQATALVGPDVDPSVAAHTLGSAAYWKLLWDGWEPGGRTACADALHHAEEAEHTDRTVGHRARLAFFLALEGAYDDAIIAATSAHDEAVALGDSSESLLARFYGGLALLLAGRLKDARVHASRARDEAVLNGHAPWGALFLVQLAWIAVESQSGEAWSLAEASLKEAEPLGHRFILGFASVVAGLAEVARDASGDARKHFERAEGEPYLMDWFCRMIALTGRHRLGEEGADQQLRELAEPMGASRFLAWCS